MKKSGNKGFWQSSNSNTSSANNNSNMGQNNTQNDNNMLQQLMNNIEQQKKNGTFDARNFQEMAKRIEPFLAESDRVTMNEFVEKILNND